MNRVIAAVKKIRISQILMTFLAGVLLVVSTACSNGPAQAGNGTQTGERQNVPAGKLAVPGKDNPRPEVPGGTATSPSSDLKNSFQKGTMNEFSDVDPRAKDFEKAAAAKASVLRENAERNVIDETGNIGETSRRILDKKGENVQDLGSNLKGSAAGATEKAKETAENLGKAAKQGTENLKDNTLDAAKGVTRGASRTAENLKDNTLDATKDVTRGANRAAENAADNTQSTSKNLVDNAQEAVENAGGFFQNKINQAARGSQRSLDKAAQNTLNKAGNAINDAVDID